MTALVGPSGGGKSTAARLAARFWDIAEGTVRLGGVDVSTVDGEALLKNYAIVFQDVVLFADTVMENIRLGKRDATDEEVLAAAKAAQCDAFVSKLPDGYHTDRGKRLPAFRRRAAAHLHCPRHLEGRAGDFAGRGNGLTGRGKRNGGAGGTVRIDQG